MKISASRASGHDNISSVFVWNTATSISLPLSKVFNICLSNGFFPDQWKLANIVPILKTGNKSDVASYRPISILPLFSSVYQKIILNRISHFTSNFLSDSQHGFLPVRSCMTNLSVLQKHVCATFENNSQLDSIFGSMEGFRFY